MGSGAATNGGDVYWLYVTFYGARPRYDDSVGELEVFAGGIRVMGCRVHQRPDDAEHLVHVDGVDSFTPGAWTDELWALVEWLGNPVNLAAAYAQCQRALKDVQMLGARRDGPSSLPSPFHATDRLALEPAPSTDRGRDVQRRA